VGVEVKAAATVTASDFRGLRKLRDGGGIYSGCDLHLHGAPRQV
jgi:hypothetical protein